VSHGSGQPPCDDDCSPGAFSAGPRANLASSGKQGLWLLHGRARSSLQRRFSTIVETCRLRQTCVCRLCLLPCRVKHGDQGSARGVALNRLPPGGLIAQEDMGIEYRCDKGACGVQRRTHSPPALDRQGCPMLGCTCELRSRRKHTDGS